MLTKQYYETNIETAMRLELERRGYKKGKDFVLFYPVRCGRIIDIAFVNEMIAIECDGEHWHGRTPSQRKKDGFKTHQLINGGWKVLRFKGNDILNNINKCADKIEEILNLKRKELI